MVVIYYRYFICTKTDFRYVWYDMQWSVAEFIKMMYPKQWWQASQPVLVSQSTSSLLAEMGSPDMSAIIAQYTLYAIGYILCTTVYNFQVRAVHRTDGLATMTDGAVSWSHTACVHRICYPGNYPSITQPVAVDTVDTPAGLNPWTNVGWCRPSIGPAFRATHPVLVRVCLWASFHFCG